MEEEIRNCLKVLQTGGTILYPTDTVWGIGCDATSYEAVEKVYSLKRRSESKSLIILVDDARMIADYVSAIPEIAWDLLKQVDTPLTIIYPGAKNLASNVVGDDNSIAIRVVKHKFCRSLIRTFGKPIVSTSANVSGASPPHAFRNIDRAIIDGAGYVVDRSLEQFLVARPSRIIKLNKNGEFRIIRN